jgi:hypothetical protein
MRDEMFPRRVVNTIGCSERSWLDTHTSHKDTEQSTIEASITLGGITLTDSGDHRMNDLKFAGRYQCLPIRRSGRLISLQNEHYIATYNYGHYLFM